MRTRMHHFGTRRNRPDSPHRLRRRGARLGREAIALALAAALGLTLAACGGNSDAPSATHTASNGDKYNDVDAKFASDMVQHHAMALAMVAMTDGRPLDPAVKTLTEQIRDAQAPEIETMAGWLHDWGREVPATVNDHAHGEHGDSGSDAMGDMDNTGGDMPGMMSAKQMSELKHATNAEFQDMWLEMMVEHHRGAITMSKVEQADGRFGDAIALAKRIVSSQQAEVDTMEKMLG